MHRIMRFACLAVLGAVPAMAQYGPPQQPGYGNQPGYGQGNGNGDPWNYGGGGRGPGNWDQSWNNRPNPRAGACFYTDRNFGGNHFCVRSGDRLTSLPGNFGDNISSIQIFGRGRVQVYDDRNFQGRNFSFRGPVADLRQVPSRPGHTWNNRISSIAVR